MPRLLYLYPEEWTGRRAREQHTFLTCTALAEAGIELTLVTAGGLDLTTEAKRLGAPELSERFSVVNLSRRFACVRSARIFEGRFRRWLRTVPAFDAGFVIHLKAAGMLRATGLPYWWEAHEIFAETPEPGSAAEQRIHATEAEALAQAAGRIATSQALADALRQRYESGSVSNLSFSIIPHGGPAPDDSPLAFNADGPLIYAGTLAGWKGLDIAVSAAAKANIPLRLIGGNRDECDRLRSQLGESAAANIDWTPRIPASELASHLQGARAGLIPTLPETGSGRYSLPMKLWDYARAGLPVVATNLPSLDSLGLEATSPASPDSPWCRRVAEPTITAWQEALTPSFTQLHAEAARAWAAHNTWAVRGQRIAKLLT